MPEMVNVDKEQGIILIDSSNLVDTDDLSKSLETVLQIAQDTGFTKVLVDTSTLILLPSLLHLHLFAEELSRKTQGFKHAIVVSEHSPKDLGHIETAAMNRGVHIQMFTSKTDALNWLNRQ
jgi:hypothetical protein